MQQIQHLLAKQTRNAGRTKVRIIANVRKMMSNNGFQQNENDGNKKFKITRKQNFSTNMRAAFLENLSRSNC
jgi:predicted transcriptional regulator